MVENLNAIKTRGYCCFFPQNLCSLTDQFTICRIKSGKFWLFIRISFKKQHFTRGMNTSELRQNPKERLYKLQFASRNSKHLNWGQSVLFSKEMYGQKKKHTTELWLYWLHFLPRSSSFFYVCPKYQESRSSENTHLLLKWVFFLVLGIQRYLCVTGCC